MSRFDRLARVWDFVLAGRPLVALAAVLLTTTGHTMNLREMGVAKGWVAAEVYALQSSYLVSLALMLLVCPTLGQRWSCRGFAQTGLAILAAGSFLNGLSIYEPLSIFLAGRVLAGAGAGMTIYFAPRLLDPRWQIPTTWAAILLPVAGPGVISSASMIQDVSDWKWGFLFEGGVAVVSLLLILSMEEPVELRPPKPRGSLAYFPGLVVAALALLFCLHWGQLHGWLESSDIVIASVVGIFALAVALWLAWPQLDALALRENGLRLALFFFGGLCQFFHGYTMNVYGGSLINFSSWQRAWLIWPMPIGVAIGLAVAQPRWGHRRLPLGLPGAVAGLIVLAVGLYLSLQRTMDWPFWRILDTIDLNWFQAPQHWELAPGRFLMGLGIGLFMIAMDTLVSPDPEREEKVRPFLLVMQFLGGGIAAAVFVNFLLIGHLVHYSYSADRDYIQAGEMAQRRTVLRDALSEAGDRAPDRAAEVLLYRGVNYEADNLVFASIYSMFFIATLILAGIVLMVWIGRWLFPSLRGEAYLAR
ncbi:MAG TPA: hypothetical protein VN688_31640 [Gemmataceae bacterium]|nr:hypothetical protein [Gemmataceae bacterium]